MQSFEFLRYQIFVVHIKLKENNENNKEIAQVKMYAIFLHYSIRAVFLIQLNNAHLILCEDIQETCLVSKIRNVLIATPWLHIRHVRYCDIWCKSDITMKIGLKIMCINFLKVRKILSYSNRVNCAIFLKSECLQLDRQWTYLHTFMKNLHTMK